jgi:gluconokinase
MICILMGVSGAGKSTIGQLVGQHLGWQFYDGDRFHPPENIAKMSSGIPLDDRDRLPWLLALQNLIEKTRHDNTHAIIACSALKQSYRQLLQGEQQDILWVYLKGSYAQIWQRIQQRQNHYMKAEMLRSQLESLEEPTDAVVIEISSTPEAIAAQIVELLKSY